MASLAPLSAITLLQEPGLLIGFWVKAEQRNICAILWRKNNSLVQQSTNRTNEIKQARHLLFILKNPWD